MIPPAPVRGGRALLPTRLAGPFLAGCVGLGALAAGRITFSETETLTEHFLVRQDGWVAAAMAAAVLAGWLIPAPAMRPARWQVSVLAERAFVAACALLTLTIGWAGWALVFARYPLSMDEFWATFDAQAFARGRLIAPVALPWRPFVPALQPMWRLDTLGQSGWSSLYLPLNAAWRALFIRLGDGGLANPVLAAAGLTAVWAAGRRLWPEDRGAARVALVLAATSSQLLITAMTPYAMTAHFALNAVWLWLYLRKTPLSLAAAAAVGFAACGLHQLIFHLLFVAPFGLELLLARRWRAAAFLALSYGAIALFWVSYWAFALPAAGLAAAASAGLGGGFFVTRVTALILAFDPSGVLTMAENGLRFIAWQNLVATPLALAGAWAAVRRPGALRPLALGIVLTLAVMTLILPYQGHGWGYRYLSGSLGAAALIAGEGWRGLRARPGGWPAGPAVVVAASLISLLVLLPLHAWQARSFVRPYATAHAMIARSRAEVVIVDPLGLWFGIDLVRNDPFLEAGPKVMLLQSLSPRGIEAVCRAHSVAVFDRAQGLAAGLRATEQGPRPGDEARLRVLNAAAACGAARRVR